MDFRWPQLAGLFQQWRSRSISGEVRSYESLLQAALPGLCTPTFLCIKALPSMLLFFCPGIF